MVSDSTGERDFAGYDTDANTVGDGFTLSSSKGKCGVSNGALSCGSSAAATVFTADEGNLAYGGSSAFSVDAAPKGSTQAAVHAGSGAVDITITWTAS